jgi:hypothetical protein
VAELSRSGNSEMAKAIAGSVCLRSFQLRRLVRFRCLEIVSGEAYSLQEIFFGDVNRQACSDEATFASDVASHALPRPHND